MYLYKVPTQNLTVAELRYGLFLLGVLGMERLRGGGAVCRLLHYR